jgi:hypothetical protein
MEVLTYPREPAAADSVDGQKLAEELGDRVRFGDAGRRLGRMKRQRWFGAAAKAPPLLLVLVAGVEGDGARGDGCHDCSSAGGAWSRSRWGDCCAAVEYENVGQRYKAAEKGKREREMRHRPRSPLTKGKLMAT